MIEKLFFLLLFTKSRLFQGQRVKSAQTDAGDN